MAVKAKRIDPELAWRRAMGLRLEYATIIFGSWRQATLCQICVNHSFAEPEHFGPVWEGGRPWHTAGS